MLFDPEPDKITCSQCIGCIGARIPASSSDVGLLDVDIRKITKFLMTSAYVTLDLSVKDQASVVKSNRFFSFQN